MVSSRLAALTVVLAGLSLTSAFDESCNSNLVTYWGQNTMGILNPTDRSKWEKPLRDYCNDDTLDVINIGFMNVFNGDAGQLPEINISYHCTGPKFPGTNLLNCAEIGPDIEYCQSKGKKVTMSLGGAAGSYGLDNEADSDRFAKTIWDILLGGSSNTRPFGSAVLDGIDLDIEAGVNTGYGPFIRKLRSYFDTDKSRKYITSAAPQCPYPDYFLGNALDQAYFDMVYIQFYNNYCTPTIPGHFNYGVWDHWAKTKSLNRDVKLFIGTLGNPRAGSYGYMTPDELKPLIDNTRKQYSSFGGIMTWEVSTAESSMINGISFAQSVKNILMDGGKCSGHPQPPTPEHHTTHKPNESHQHAESHKTTEPHKHTEAHKTTKHSEEHKTTKTHEHSEPHKTTEPHKHTEAHKTTKHSEEHKTTKTREHSEAHMTTKHSEEHKTTKTHEHSEPHKTTEPHKHTEDHKTTKHSEEHKTTKTHEHSEAHKTTKHSEEHKTTKTHEHSEPHKTTEPHKHTEDHKTTKHSEEHKTTKTHEHSEPHKTTEPHKHTEAHKTTKHSEEHKTTKTHEHSKTPKPTESPKPTPEHCPVQNGPCNTVNLECKGNQYAQCVFGRWVLRKCDAHNLLTCVQDNALVYCDWAYKHPHQPACTSPQGAIKKRSIEGPSNHALIDFAAPEYNEENFKTTVRVRTTSTSFSNHWRVQFELPRGQTVLNNTRGVFTQKGNKVTIISVPEKEPKWNMAILIDIMGTHKNTTQITPIQPKFWDLGEI